MFKKANLAMALLCMLTQDEIIIDHNEQQGLTTLTNKTGDCYVTITTDEFNALCSTFKLSEEVIDDDPETVRFNNLMETDMNQEEYGIMEVESKLNPTHTYPEPMTKINSEML